MSLTCKLTNGGQTSSIWPLPRRQYSFSLITPGPGTRLLGAISIAQSSPKSFRLANGQMFTLPWLAFPAKKKKNPNKGHVLSIPLPPALLPDQNLAVFLWLCMGSCASLPEGTVKLNFSLSGADLSLSSLSHLYKLRPRHKTVLNFHLFLSHPGFLPSPQHMCIQTRIPSRGGRISGWLGVTATQSRITLSNILQMGKYSKGLKGFLL